MVRRRRKPPSGQRWSIFKCCRPVGFPSTYKGVYDEKNQLSIRSKFQKGIPHINAKRFMGFDQDSEGKLIVNEEEAKLVRRIYREA